MSRNTLFALSTSLLLAAAPGAAVARFAPLPGAPPAPAGHHSSLGPGAMAAPTMAMITGSGLSWRRRLAPMTDPPPPPLTTTPCLYPENRVPAPSGLS
jgi:hypothetical protein